MVTSTSLIPKFLLDPTKLHDRHKDLPLAPEHYNNKLCTTLFDKKDYIVHSRNLKFYLRKGLKLKKVNRVIAFDQDNYMKKYIKLNTKLRTKSKTDFEKDFFKLMNNSVYGKQMENVRNRTNVKIARTEKMMEKLIKSSNFQSRTILDKIAVLLHGKNVKIKLNKGHSCIRI